MRLSDLLEECVITVNLRARDQKAAFAEMTGILERTGKIDNASRVLDALLNREACGNTSLGKGIAFPHARIDGLKQPIALLALSQSGVRYNGPNALPVYLFFLFLTATESTDLHLQILSKAAAIFSDTRLYHGLRKAKSQQAVLQLLQNHEKGGKEAFFPLTVGEIFTELGTGLGGLTNEEAALRVARYGPNLLKEVKAKSLLLRFVENLTNLFAVLLWVGGVLAFIADMAEMGIAIFIVILVNALFSFWQEHKAERALDALKKLIPKKTRVVRSGKEQVVPAEGLVPGDIMLLEEGDAVSADARLIEADAMRVDNSALTGESKPIHKTAEAVLDGKQFLWTELPNLVFAGTTVASGRGKAAVMSTGMHTEIGRIASLTQELTEEKSPLQREIETVTKIVTVLAVAMGVLFFFVGIGIGKLSLSAAFLFTIGIIVANVPEGLLPTVSLSLAMAVQRMVRRNVLVKRLSSVETLGCTTVICTDKTGTLTTNEMTVTRIWISGRQLDVTGSKYEPVGSFSHDGVALSHEEMRQIGLYRLFDASVLCNNAVLVPPRAADGRWSIVGDPTEAAMLVMAAKGGVDPGVRNNALPRVAHLPFESVRKRMTCVNIVDGKPMAHVKGAPSEMLHLCSHILADGSIEPMTDSQRSAALAQNDQLAKEGLRVLAVAAHPLDILDGFTIENAERDMVFLGLVGMMDPPRPEVPNAIELCRRAGIRVVMITGDYGLTASAIARKIGLARSGEPRVATGQELSEMDDERLKALLARDVIFARTTPEQKMRIVSAFKALGEVVAATGDGVNDAPALKKADIGVAMGIRGSDVAKEAAAMILTDDNFASIVSAIEEGRAVYSNIKKFVTYIFSSNIPEVIPFIAFVLFRIPLPLTVMQVLAVDLGTDLVPALGLGTEAPEPGTMEKPPRPKNKKILDLPLLLRAYCFLGPIEAALSLAAFFFVYRHHGWLPGMTMADTGSLYRLATTMTLAGIVASQVGNVLACRTDRESIFRVGLFSNRLVIWGILTELCIISLLIYSPILQHVFGLASLGVSDWIVLLAFAPVLVIADEVRKLILRRYSSFRSFLKT